MVEDPSPLLPPAEESIETPSGEGHELAAESGEPSSSPDGEPGFLCAGDEWMSSCKGLPFYKQHENGPYCVLHYPGKEKIAAFKAALDRKLNDKDFDFNGVWFPEISFAGIVFSADANFNSATFSADANFNSATFSANAYFMSVTFSAGACFRSARFNAPVYFGSAIFREAADFRSAAFNTDADFSFAKFSADADFTRTMFKEAANFYGAVFETNADFHSSSIVGKADFYSGTVKGLGGFSSTSFGGMAQFSNATLAGATDFSQSTFSLEADFSGTTFGGENNFSYATFKDYGSFSSSKGSPFFDFDWVRIERPDRFFFPPVELHTKWFRNVDARKLDLANVEWPTNIDQEIESVTSKGDSSRRRFAVIYRRLAISAEENHRYDIASVFRYASMEMRRPDKWEGPKLWKTDWMYQLYWATSGYGERIVRALAWLVAIWLVFAALYTQVGFTRWEPKLTNESEVASDHLDYERAPLPLPRTLTYSLAVMSLQKPDPKPLTGTAQTLVLLETILGPVQAALLALAIRRKFMR